MTSIRPVVSVIVPCFNRAATLRPTIASVLGQAFTNWELIVVDDASPDDLAAAVNEYTRDPRIRHVRHAHNRGASAARNTGVQVARGRFVAFLDSDDIWLPQKLERQVSAISAMDHPEAVVCVTQTLVVRPGGWRCVRPRRPPLPGRSFGEYLYSDGGFAQVSSFLLATALARRAPFRESLRRLEDHMFFIDLGLAGASYLLVDEPLTVLNDDPRPDRLSLTGDITSVQSFLEQAARILPPHVLLAFEARVLSAPLWHESRLNSLKLLFRALRAGALSLRQISILFLRNAMPNTAYDALRHWVT